VVGDGDAADVGVDGVLDLGVLRVVVRLGLTLLLRSVDLAQLAAEAEAASLAPL